MKDSSLEVTVPAPLLDALAALAGGYTMSHGMFIDRRAIGIARDILWQAGYGYTDDEPFPETYDWETR